MTSSSRRCTHAADAGSISALTLTGEGGLTLCSAAQGPALTCSAQLCLTAPPRVADCVPALPCLRALQGTAPLRRASTRPLGLGVQGAHLQS